MINVNHLYKDFGSLKVLKDVTFSVAEKEVVVIIGPSGSGKSTVLRCINYLETPTSGSIIVDGLDLSNKANLNDVRKEVGMVFQRFNLFPHKTVLENIILAPMQVRKISRDEAVENARKLLQKVGLADKEDAYPEQLSGGQQQRVAIARALAMKPKILFFDEPTSALDPEMVQEVLDVMVELAQENITMICVTHEMGFARQVADRVVFMDDGQILEEGTPDHFFENPENPRCRDFLSKILH